MNSKVLKVFYGADNLPYKDKERVVHFPVVGGAFMGASNTTEIWFYFDKIGEPNNTWVAIAKLPNGKRGAVKLDTFNDTELNEPYAKLQLNTWFTQMRGDVYISLNGYDGGPILTKDPETNLYEVTGTPVIQATGSVKLTIQYATQLIGGDEIDEVTLQEIYAMFGEKLDTDKGIVVIANPEVDISEYDNGQYFYSNVDHSIYKKVSGALALRFTAYSKTESDNKYFIKASNNTASGNNTFSGTNTFSGQNTFSGRAVFSGNANLYNTYLTTNTKNYFARVGTTTSQYVMYKLPYNYSDLGSEATYTLITKEYTDTQLALKVDKTTTASQVYATNYQGNQTTIGFSSSASGTTIALRDSSGQLNVALTPTANNNATSKKYVDDGLSLKANQATTYTKTEVDNAIASAVSSTYKYKGTKTVAEINALDTSGLVVGWVYNVSNSGTITLGSLVVNAGDNIAWTGSAWDILAGVVDLSNYYTKTQADNKFVEQVSGKGLSSNDFTDAYKSKLDGIEAGAEVNIIEEIKVDNVSLVPVDKSVNIDLSGKQDLLVSGTNIKSINNTSLLGSGNIDYDNALSDSSTNAVQNKVLKGYLDDIGNRLAVLEESIIADESLQYSYLSDSAIPTNVNTYPIIESAGMDMSNVKGNSFVYNQQVENGNFESTSGWSTTSASISVANNILTFNASSRYGSVQRTCDIINGNKYLIVSKLKLTTATTGVNLGFKAGGYMISLKSTTETTNWQTIYAIGTADSSCDGVKLADYREDNRDDILVDYILLINLTQSGLDSVATADEAIAELLKRGINVYEYNPYNAGEIRDSKPTALISKPFNVWDEQWELGDLSSTTGQPIETNDRIRTKNFIGIIPNTTYYVKMPVYNLRIIQYDKDYNMVDYGSSLISNTTFITKQNACYIKFYCNPNYGTTYNHDICINISNATLNGKYRPYKAPISYPLSLPVLRSAGSVQDDVENKYIVEYTFTGNESGGIFSGNAFFVYLGGSSGTYTIKSNALILIGLTMDSYANVENNTNINTMTVNNGTTGAVAFYIEGITSLASLKTWLTGKTIYFALNTPTDQPAITLPENIEFEKGGSLEVTYDETAPTPADFDFEVAVYKPIE